MKITRIFLLLIPVFSFFDSVQSQTLLPLNNWEVGITGSAEKYTTQIPSTVHSVLWDNKIIANPYIGQIESRIQWIGDTSWTYNCTINLTNDQLKFKNANLNFEGLDTYADVFVNDKLVIQADNMFRSWQTDIKSLLTTGTNSIRIQFSPPAKKTAKLWKLLGANLPGDQRVLTRKAQYQNGWDFAPKYVTMGIWKPAFIEFYDIKLLDKLNWTYSINNGIPNINVSFNAFNPSKENIFAGIEINDNSAAIEIGPGLSTLEIPLAIQETNLWNPNGLGDQNLYDLNFFLRSSKATLVDTSIVIGFRDIQLNSSVDEIGMKFQFESKGESFFVKGANYVPTDILPDRVSKEQIKSLLIDAKKSNFNMLRVWGGGYYESDYFYDICDSLGIMVWQDFAFACAMYPNDKNFLDNVKSEAEEQVKRLSRHPSIVLWCGNNEISEGWARWGWKDGMSEQQKAELQKAYDKIFHEILPQTVIKYAPHCAYWASSPLWGRGDKRHQTEGDAHYWGVWHDEEEFEVLEEKIPRFMSEFGFQAYPVTKTIADFSGESLNENEISINAHQKHKKGRQIIDKYLDRNYPTAQDFTDYVYLTQVNQAEGISLGLLAQRMAGQNKYGGSLYWQYNDCWPGITWSSRDYYGRWKPLQWKAKEVFAPNVQRISFKKGKNIVEIASDNQQSFSYKMGLISTTGEILEEKMGKTKLWDQTGIQKLEMPVYDKYTARNDILFFSKILSMDGSIYLSLRPYKKMKDLEWSSMPLEYEIKEIEQGFEITLKSKALYFGVWLDTAIDGTWSDNYFHLMPGTKKVIFTTNKKIEDFDQVLQIHHLGKKNQ